MLQLNLPPFEYRLRENFGKLQIFDPIRKKYVQLTPEEWVRQHILNLLNSHLNYPTALTKVEGGLKYNNRQKRTDVVIYSKDLAPLVLVECKAPEVKIDQKVIDQLSVYNKKSKAPLVISTNGIQTYAMLCNNPDNTQMLKEIPSYEDLIQLL